MLRRVRSWGFKQFDAAYRRIANSRIYHAESLRYIPGPELRRTYPLPEWAYEIGLFHALMYEHLSNHTDPVIVDLGCGRGKFVPVALPLINKKGRYVGVDVDSAKIAQCREAYPLQHTEFIHHDAQNPAYTPDSPNALVPYDLPDNYADMVVALSVWTHLVPPQAGFYMSEVSRMLKPGGAAVLTFFVLDAAFNPDEQERWKFIRSVEGSKDFFTTSTARVAEEEVGVTEEGIASLAKDAGLEWVKSYPGYWKGPGGLYFQDVCVFRR